MILKEKYEKATLLLLDMIIMSDRFDNELTSEKGVGKVFDKLITYSLQVFTNSESANFFHDIFLIFF